MPVQCPEGFSDAERPRSLLRSPGTGRASAELKIERASAELRIMKITKIESIKGSRKRKVYSDGSLLFLAYPAELRAYGIEEGEELSSDSISCTSVSAPSAVSIMEIPVFALRVATETPSICVSILRPIA